MIQDGVIIFEARNITFWNWQFDSELLNVSILAILTTLLAYQLTATCINIELGSKEMGTSTACDIHKLMLSEYSSSPFEIIAAVARLDSLDRHQFKGYLPENVRITRRDSRVSKGATFSLTILLFVAPMFNLASIFITLQRDEMITFNKAMARGVAFGVDYNYPDQEKLKPKFESISAFQFVTAICEQVPSRIVGPVTPLVKFSRCIDFQKPRSQLFHCVEVHLIAETTFQGQIKLSVITLPSNMSTRASIQIDMASRGKLFRLQPVFATEDAALLISKGQEKLAEFCESAMQNNSPHDESLLNVDEATNGILRVSKHVKCNLTSPNSLFDVLLSMNQLHIIDHNSTKVVNVESLSSGTSSAPEYFDAGGMAFLLRRGRNVNVLPMLFVTLLSFLLRITTDWGFNNDTDKGIEAILRYRLGVKPHESLLRSSQTIAYSYKREGDLNEPHHLPSLDFREMKQFRDIFEIDMDDISSSTTSKDET